MVPVGRPSRIAYLHLWYRQHHRQVAVARLELAIERHEAGEARELLNGDLKVNSARGAIYMRVPRFIFDPIQGVHRRSTITLERVTATTIMPSHQVQRLR